MKKLFALILFILSFTGASAYAEAPFGELTYKADDGLYLFSNGGSGEYDSFGFVLSDGVKTIHIYQISCDFDKPYCAVLKSFPKKELEVRQFVCSEEGFLYDLPVYITLKNDQLTAKTLEQKKSEAILNLKAAVDISLYREAERLSIEKILLDAEGEINALNTAYDIENVVNEAKGQILAFKTDQELFEEALAALRAEAILNLKNTVDISLYREAERLSIEKILLDAEGEINALNTAYDIENVVNGAKEQILAFKTDEELLKEELAALRAEAILNLKAAVDISLYREAERLSIEKILLDAEGEINTLNTAYEIEDAVNRALEKLSQLKTDQELFEEELAALRMEAVLNLKNTVDISLYREAERLSIEKILLDAEGEINTLNTASDIENVVNGAKEQILAFKTDEELLKEELAALRMEAVLNLKNTVDISLYREAERLSIEKILLDAEGEINTLNTASDIENAVNRALEKLSQLKTDQELFEEELAALRAEEISAVSGLLDKTLYREAEQQIIEQIISEAAEAINSAGDMETVLAVASEAKAKLGDIPTDEKCKENTLLNDEVLYYLGKAYDRLLGFRSNYHIGRDIMKRMLPIIGIVLDDGDYGRIYITPEYISEAYEGDVTYVKQKYGEMTDNDRENFRIEIYDRVKDEIALEFLREYFGLYY